MRSSIAFIFIAVASIAAGVASAAVNETYNIPVVCLHGLNSSAAEACFLLRDHLEKIHPGQPFFPLALDEEGDSFKNIYEQISDVQAAIRSLMNKYPAKFKYGFHFVGHSQGGLVARAVIEESDDFRVRKFVSLAGVQAGEYGNCDTFFGAMDCPTLTNMMYSWIMRNVTSVAQYWRDPNPDRYLSGNAFLPYINNEINPALYRWKNFVALDHLYLFATDGDAIIVPWQSCFFGFYDTDGETIIPMEKQRYYIDDTFGLRTLAESGRVTMTMVPGKTHGSWIHDIEMIKKYVAPVLVD